MFFEQKHISTAELETQFDEIMDQMLEPCETVWIVDYKVALIPADLYTKLKSVQQEDDGRLQG